MIAKALVVGAAALSLGLAPASAQPGRAAPPGQPTAAAWLVDVTVTSGTTSGVQVAAARAQSGTAAHAWGAPLTVNGTSYQEAGATDAKPQDAKAAVDYTDQTGSLTLTGGYTKAVVGGGSAEVRTGFGSASGSGFAMASKLLTWDQQKRLMDQFTALNDAVFDPLNARLQALAPVFAAAGLTAPHLTKMTALAAINLGSGDISAASVSTASGPGLSAAKAAVTLTGVQLLDGFIRLADIQAKADSESVGGEDERSASVRIGSVSVAGVDVTIDDGGFHLVGNTPVQKATIQPTLDQLYTTLKEHGVTLAVDETEAVGDLRQATAFRLSVASPQGTLSLTLGHVEASAATVGGVLPAVPGGSAPPEAGRGAGAGGGGVPTGAGAGPGAAPIADVTVPVPGASPPATGGGGQAVVAGRHGVPPWLGATPPAAVGRALGTVFLLLLVAGLGMALIPILLMRVRPTARRQPLIDPEVLS